MPRPREFDTDELLEKAMLAFLQRGLQRTSMRQLEAATGVRQVSLYNAFGSKEGLFLAAFDRYIKLATSIQEGFLQNTDLEGISAYAWAIVDEASPMPQAQSGCMIVNTALIAEAAGDKVKGRVHAFRAEMKARFVAAFERAKERGILRPGLDVDQCVEFVISAIWGIYVNIRLTGCDPTVGRPAAAALEATLKNWTLPVSDAA